MTHHKKKLTQFKTKQFLNKFPIILIFQQTDFTVTDWLHFRKTLHQQITSQFHSQVVDCEILKVKNCVLKKIFSTSPDLSLLSASYKQEHSVPLVFQGPNCLIGCQNLEQLKIVWNFLNSPSKLDQFGNKKIFISCLFYNKLWNHLDIQALLKIDKSIYLDFMATLNRQTLFYSTLRDHLNLYPLFTIQNSLIQVIDSMTFSVPNYPNLQKNCINLEQKTLPE